MGLINIGNGLSEMGKSVADQAGAMGLNLQKADLEKQSALLADQLATAREHTGRVESGQIAAEAQGRQQDFEVGQQGRQQQFESGQQDKRLLTETDLEHARITSSEKISRGDQQLRREAMTPEEVRTAEWMTKATPEQKQAFQQTLLAKAGIPLWMMGDGAAQGAAPGAGLPTAAGSTPAATPDPGKAASTATPTGYNEDALKGVPPQSASVIKAMIEGRQPPPTSMAMSKPYWQQMITLANAYDPSFDQTTWGSRAATRKDFTSGQSAKAVTAMNTALGHAGIVMDSFDKLGNFGGLATPLNGPVNFVEKTFGDQRQTNAQEAVSALSSEARKVFATTGGGNLTELENWEKNFPLNGSPDQQKGALKQFVGLLDSRLGALADQHNRGMQKTEDPINLLTPSARQVYQKLTGGEPEDATGYQLGKPPANSASTPASTVPPPAAVQELKMRGPKAAAQFDAIFGQGAAARALGNK